MDTTFKVNLAANGNWSAVHAGEAAFFDLKASIEGVLAFVKSGAFLQLGAQVNAMVTAIPRGIGDITESGIDFNAQLETAQLGVAAILKQFDETGSIKSFGDAMRMSGTAIDLLRAKAETSPATFRALTEAYQGTAGAMASAGLTIRQQVDLIAAMSQTLAGLGIRSEQILQESRALIMGNITEDAQAARILGITRAQIEATKEQGNLYGFLTGKLGAFTEAADVGRSSFNQLSSNLDDVFDSMKASLTEELFDEFKDTLQELIDLSQDADFDNLGQSIGDIASIVSGLVKFMIQWADVMTLLAATIAALGLSRWINNMLSAKSATLGQVAAIERKIAAINAETMALEAQVAANAKLQAAIRARQAAERTAANAHLPTMISRTARLGYLWQGIRSTITGLVTTMGGWITLLTVGATLLWQWSVRSRQAKKEIAEINTKTKELAESSETRLASITSEATKLEEIRSLTAEIGLLNDQRNEADKEKKRALQSQINLLEQQRLKIKGLTTADLERSAAAEKAAKSRYAASNDVESNIKVLQTNPVGLQGRLGEYKAQLTGLGDIPSSDSLIADREKLKTDLDALETKLNADIARGEKLVADSTNELQRKNLQEDVDLLKAPVEALQDQLAENALLIEKATKRKKLLAEIAELEKQIQEEADQKQTEEARIARAYKRYELESQALELEMNGDTERAAAIRRRIAAEDALQSLGKDAAALVQERVNLEDEAAKKLALSNAAAEERSRIETDLTRLQTERQIAADRGDQAEVTRLLKIEQDLINDLIAKYQALADAAPEGSLERAEALAKIASLQDRGGTTGNRSTAVEQVDARLQGLNDPTQHLQGMGEGVFGGIAGWVASIGTVADQVAQTIKSTIGAAVSGITDGIMGWIDGTKSWRESLASMGSSILRQMLQTIIQMGVQWLINTALIKTGIISIGAVEDAQRTGRVAKEAAADAATLPGKSAGAVATGIGSFGTALVFGTLALAAVMAAMGAFDVGGMTGPGNTHDVKGFVHANEWVSPEWMTQHPQYGRVIAELENVRMKGYATGGYTSLASAFTLAPSSSSSSGFLGNEQALGLLQEIASKDSHTNVAVVDSDKAATRYVSSRRGQRAIIGGSDRRRRAERRV